MLSKSVKKQKREFSLEKIASSIRCGHLISSIRNKYKDPLIIRNKHLLFQKLKSNKKNYRQNGDEDPFSLNKILIHKFIEQRQKDENENNKDTQTKNNMFDKILPIIQNKQLKNYFSKDSLLVTSGMFKQKEFLRNRIQKIKLGNMINLKTNEESIINELYPKIDNINNINDKYNLQLDLNHLNNNSLKIQRNSEQKSLNNFLFYKYITSSPIAINIDSFSNDKNENRLTIKFNTNKKESSLVNSKNCNDEVVAKNTLNECETVSNNNDCINEDNTFITKISINKKVNEKSSTIPKIYKIKNKLKKKFLEKNKNIMNYDQKINIDCLYSNVISKLEHNKLVYKSIDKTTFEIQKEPSYKRVKKFESIIDKVIKNKSNINN